MRRVQFTFDEIDALRRERYLHPHPRVQRKMDVVLLKSADISHQKIADIVGVCTNTVRAYLDEYTEGGIDRLKEIRFYKPKSELGDAENTIRDHLDKHPPSTIKQAAAEIEKITGIKRGETQVRKYLKSIGFMRRKTGSIPAKADVIKQKSFIKEKLDPVLQQARDGQKSVFFVDAAHFVFAPFLGFLWCLTRIFMRAPSGRKRFNVLGAINAVTHELISVTNDSYINATSVCDLLRMLASQCTLPIVLILDNACYQKCNVVQELADELMIELLYIPSYSPNLNIIERVWKFTKCHCLNSKYYDNFDSFRGAISHFLNNIHINHSDDLATLLTHRFQTFDMESIRWTA